MNFILFYLILFKMKYNKLVTWEKLSTSGLLTQTKLQKVNDDNSLTYLFHFKFKFFLKNLEKRQRRLTESN